MVAAGGVSKARETKNPPEEKTKPTRQLAQNKILIPLNDFVRDKNADAHKTGKIKSESIKNAPNNCMATATTSAISKTITV